MLLPATLKVDMLSQITKKKKSNCICWLKGWKSQVEAHDLEAGFKYLYVPSIRKRPLIKIIELWLQWFRTCVAETARQSCPRRWRQGCTAASQNIPPGNSRPFSHHPQFQSLLFLSHSSSSSSGVGALVYKCLLEFFITLSLLHRTYRCSVPA